MGAATLTSLNEYLNTSYEPDMEFVDGILVRRNAGTQLHGWLQTILASYFRQVRSSHRIRVFSGTRLRVNATTGRHRVPDVLVLEIPYEKGKVVVDVPAIIVEIKSPDDTFDDIIDKCFDYENQSVPNIVLMDPDNKRCWLFKKGSLQLLNGASISLGLQSRDGDRSGIRSDV